MPHADFADHQRLAKADRPIAVPCPDGRIKWAVSEKAREKLREMQRQARKEEYAIIVDNARKEHEEMQRQARKEEYPIVQERRRSNDSLYSLFEE